MAVGSGDDSMRRARYSGGHAGSQSAPAVLAVVAVLVCVSLLAPGAVHGAGAQEASSFPAPVVAPIDPVDADLRVAVVAFYAGEGSSPDQPVIIVRLAGNATALPSGSRVSVLSGDPAGEQARTSMVLIDGEPTGVVETSPDGQSWEGQSDAQVGFTPDGAVSLDLPASQASGPVWVEVETPDGASFTSGAYPLPVVLGFGEPGVLTTATLLSEQAADGNNAVVGTALDSVPEVQLVNQGITVSTATAPPTEVDGVGVTQVVDSVRIAPDYRSSTRVPFFVTIDQASGDVQLWETHDGLPGPASIPASTFVTTPLTPNGDGATITLDRARLFEAVGLSPDDEEAALGITRTLILDDGRQLIAEGPVGTVAWFDAFATPTDAPDPGVTTDEVRVAESGSGDDDSGPSAAVVAAVVALVLVLIGAAVWTTRRSRRARVDATTLDAMGKVVKPGSDEGRSAKGSAAGGVGVAGARAAVTRRAREQADASEPADVESPESDDAEDTLAAVYAAMRRKASEAERPGVSQTGRDESAEEPDVPAPEPDKATRPDQALDALNRLIDDLDN